MAEVDEVVTEEGTQEAPLTKSSKYDERSEKSKATKSVEYSEPPGAKEEARKAQERSRRPGAR